MKKLLFLLAFVPVIGCHESKITITGDGDPGIVWTDTFENGILRVYTKDTAGILTQGYSIGGGAVMDTAVLDTTFAVDSEPRLVEVHRMMFVKDGDTTTIDTVNNKAFHSKQIFVNGIFQGCIVGD